MSIIGSYFAIGTILLICTVYFKNRYFLTRASRYFIICLMLTLASSVAYIGTNHISKLITTPVWILYAIAMSYHILTILTATFLALYLIIKVVEHIYDDNILLGKILAFSVFGLFSAFVISNIFTGHLFTVNEQKIVENGPLYFIPIVTAFLQLVPVCYYSVKHRHKMSKTIKTAAVESAMMLVFFFFIKALEPSLSIFMLSISSIELAFFLNFQNHRNGVNTLTKLNNGQKFFNELLKKIRIATPFKVYLIKINNFGYIKQNYGYRAGDEMLYLFSFSLDKLFSEGAPFHLHGTTFALILPSDKSKTPEQTKKLMEFLETKIKYKDREVKFEYIVAENFWDNGTSAHDFYEQMENALEIAKTSNLDYIKCTLDLEAARLRKKYLINRLQTIDKESGYEIWFQPVYSVNKSVFSSAEVLLRLKEKNGKFISPAEFIPIAENTGQIVPITWFVIEETCRTLSTNPELDGIRASINIPMQIIEDKNFEKKLNGIVDSYGIKHERLSFEFTERVILEDLTLAEKNMKKLAKSGYTFYLDDFGIGYSNFNCVLRLPLKTIKFDTSLTATTETIQHKNINLVYILTDLFHDMGLNVVAEGAETAEQVEALRNYGVDGIQGYYFAKPMPLEALKTFLNDQKKLSSGT